MLRMRDQRSDAPMTNRALFRFQMKVDGVIDRFSGYFSPITERFRVRHRFSRRFRRWRLEIDPFYKRYDYETAHSTPGHEHTVRVKDPRCIHDIRLERAIGPRPNLYR